MRSPCPMCGASHGEAHAVDICEACHGRLLSEGVVAVEATGEFKAVSEDDVSRFLEEARPAANQPDAVSCTWCGKAHNLVRKLLTQNGAHICNECIALCTDILQAEFGDDWRSGS